MLADPPPAAPRCLLIVPDGAINSRMGSGQRSGILFGALSRIGPTDVAILGATPGGGEVERIDSPFFPGAASVHRVQSARFPVRTPTGLAWLRYNLGRFLFVDRLYSPEQGLPERVARLLTPDHRIVAFRYALPFAVTGPGVTDGRLAVVDIDDRDDQKFDTAAQALFRGGMLYRAFAARVLPKLRARLRVVLRDADLLWYAAAEDRLDIPGPGTDVIDNVPFTAGQTAPVPEESRELLFVGTFVHRPNQDGVRWFLREIWPRIHAADPSARFRIVGLGPWNSLAAEFPGIAGVDFVGTVDDITAEYARSRIVVSPLVEGGGSKIKVIEACAMSRPVVATPHSVRGFGSDLAGAIPQAGDPAGFAAACLALLSDPQAADRLGTRLRALQQARFSREAVESRIEKALREGLATGSERVRSPGP